MGYDDTEVNVLRKRLWSAAFQFAKELRIQGRSLSGLELIQALNQMIAETYHHWIEDRLSLEDILSDKEGRRR